MTLSADLSLSEAVRHPRTGQAIRVLFMADHLGHPNGRIHGGTTYFLNTIPALRDAGFAVDPVFLGAPHTMAEHLQKDGIAVSFLDLRKYDLSSLSAIRRFLAGKSYDVAHLHSFKSHLLGRYLLRREPVATIVHVHDLISMTPPLRLVQGILGPSTSALIGVSKPVTRFGQEHYRVPAERCCTIPNGLNIAPFLAARDTVGGDKLRGELGVLPDQPVLVVAGRLNPVKGHPQLFEAMRAVVEAEPDCTLWVVGDGEARNNYEAIVDAAGLRETVRFLGQRHDMPNIFAAADVAIVPSMWEEGFGLVALEAAATGLPIVAFDTGGLSALVRDGESGILVRRGDTAALAQGVLALLRNSAIRRKLGAGALAVAQEFTIEKHLMELARLYHEVVASPK